MALLREVSHTNCYLVQLQRLRRCSGGAAPEETTSVAVWARSHNQSTISNVSLGRR
jgi:hypothetical protein